MRLNVCLSSLLANFWSESWAVKRILPPRRTACVSASRARSGHGHVAGQLVGANEVLLVASPWFGQDSLVDQSRYPQTWSPSQVRTKQNLCQRSGLAQAEAKDSGSSFSGILGEETCSRYVGLSQGPIGGGPLCRQMTDSMQARRH